MASYCMFMKEAAKTIGSMQQPCYQRTHTCREGMGMGMGNDSVLWILLASC